MNVIKVVLAVYHILACPILGALALAATLHFSGIADRLTAAGWIIGVPVLYFCWLLLTLSFCALDVQLWCRTVYRKPQRAATAEGLREFLSATLSLTLVLRCFLVRSLPMTTYLQLIPGLRQLVFLSYSPRTMLGQDSLVFGMVYDPDLLEIGDSAVIGAGVSISSHSLVTDSCGKPVYTTASVRVGPRAVVGGESRVALGVHIGSDAVVEPFSNVLPYTRIPSGEVWGGNPAVFQRKRSEVSMRNEEDGAAELPKRSSPPACDELERIVRGVVADTLNINIESVSASFSTHDCAAWDSLGQMAISAALHDRFGIDVPSDRCFQMRSISDITAYVSAHKPTGPEPTVEQDLSNPEILPLLDHELATRQLASSTSEATGAALPKDMRVVVAATFTSEPLASSLTLWSRAFGIDVRVDFAGYDQVQQTLLAPDSIFRGNSNGLNVVLARPEDLLTSSGDIKEQLVASMLSSIEQFARQNPDNLAVATLPPVVSPLWNTDRVTSDKLQTQWNSRLSQIEGIVVVDFAAVIEEIGVATAARTESEVIARAPYSARVYSELGITLARAVRKRCVAPAKVIVLDADGVLWGGVLGEEGLDGIQLGPDHPGRSFQLLQHWARGMKDRGVLLAVASRNELADVQNVFDHHPEMILRRNDISAWRVNWKPKSDNIREMAQELNLGLDSFVFLDDDPANRLEVQAYLPQVTVVPLPNEPTGYRNMLGRLWCFDASATTTEDLQRTRMIQQEQTRQQLREEATDLNSYLQSLDIRVRMRAAWPADLPRVAQLTQKTNQFNLSLKRRNLQDIQRLSAEHTVCIVEVSDHFGDYGLVGVCILMRAETVPTQFEIDTFLLSCRALGRGVEDAMVYGLMELVRAEGGRELRADFVEGPRNQPVRDFFRRIGFSESKTGQFDCATQNALTLPEYISWTGPLDRAVKAVG